MKHLFLKYVIFVNLVISILAISCNQHGTKESGVIVSDSLYLKNVPPQPGEERLGNGLIKNLSTIIDMG